MLAGRHADEAELPADGGTHHQVVQALARTLVFLLFTVAVVQQQVAADDGDGRVVAQALALQAGCFLLIAVLVFGHLELGLALDAHAELFLLQFEALAQLLQLVVGLQGLLLQGEALLFHFDFLFAVGDELLLPLVTLVFDGTQQVEVLQHKDGVSLLHHVALLAYNAAHAARLAGVDLDGEDGLHESFDVDILHELVVFHFSHLQALGVDAQLARASRKDDDVDKEGGKYHSACQIVTVTDVPGFLFEFDIHRFLFYCLPQRTRSPTEFQFFY